jgi:putative endonuclease
MTASTKRRRAERWGRRAESLAALQLRLTGWRILDQRARTGAGELDIVARRGKVLAFVEVKARGDLATALAAVTPYQRQRLLRAAAIWRGRRADLADLEVRFDLIVCAPWRWPRKRVAAFTAETGSSLDLL